MKYHNYLERIFGSKIKIDLLRTVYNFPNKKWTIRELAKFNNKNHSAINYAIKDLQEMNLIEMEHYGRSNLVSLNKNSILNKLLEIFELEDNTLSELIRDIKNLLNNRVVSCILYGSIARKDEGPDSDIDLLIIAKNKNLVRDLISEKQKYFSEKYGNLIMPKIFTKKQFNKNLPFIKTIGKNYIVILGEDILK